MLHFDLINQDPTFEKKVEKMPGSRYHQYTSKGRCLFFLFFVEETSKHFVFENYALTEGRTGFRFCKSTWKKIPATEELVGEQL